MRTHHLPSPNYAAIRRADLVLSQAHTPLEDLIAVFTTSDATGGLLVYNTEHAPPLNPKLVQDGWSSRTLADLQPDEYARIDGPIMTLAAIDELLDDIPTHGVCFFPLEDMEVFRQPQNREISRRTAFRLAQVAARRWQQLPAGETEQRRSAFGKRIVQLCLPLALATYQDADLVALRFDLSDLSNLHTIDRVARPVFNRPSDPNDIQSPGDLGDEEWVAGLKEILLILPALDRHRSRLLRFRPALRQFAEHALVPAICRGLAQRCWQLWNTTGDTTLQHAAYALAAESWLEDQDAADLVAIFPDQDFDRFARHGQARAVSRGHVSRAADKRAWCSLEDVLRDEQSVPAGPVFAIPVLESLLRQRGATVVFDLGPLLWQAERYTDLARTFWLLSRDLLEPPNADWRRVGASNAAIIDLAQRAALIYGLGNPWAWRQGRSSLLVADCYAHLDRCLARQEQIAPGTSRSAYYAALRSWYGCALAEDVRGNLSRVIELSDTSLLASRDEDLTAEATSESQTAAHLSAAARRLLPGTRETSSGTWKITNVTELLRSVTQCAEPVPIPSPMFGYWSHKLLDAESRWQQIQAAASERRPDAAALNRLQEDLTRWQRRAFAPYHELQALLAAFRAESEQVRRLQQAVGEGAAIKFAMRTSEISLGSKQTVAFEVQNNGNHPASSFVWRLERYTGFELVSNAASRGPTELGPGERQTFDIQVRAIEPTLMLVFSYRYRDRAGQIQSDEERTNLRARRETPGLRTKINPFEVGRPVAGTAFFGRRHEIAKILTRLARGDTHPLVLRGPRRIGKSSLMREIAALLEQPVSKARDIGLSPEVHSALHNVRPVLTSLQKLDRSLSRPFESFLRSLLEDICRALGIDAPPVIQEFSRTADTFGVPPAFMKQVETILRQRPGTRLVILLDELDEAFREDARETAKQLRNIIETETRVSWITASTMLVKGSAGSYGSPWFNLLEPIELRAMDWPAAFQLVRQLGGWAGFDWSEEAITALLQLSGRRPYLIQLLGARITDDLNAQDRDRVASGDVAAAVSHLLDEIGVTGSFLGFVWNEAQWLGKLMLWQLLHAAQPLRTIDLHRQVRQMMEAQAPIMNVGGFYAEFDERLAWLTDIADTLELDQGQHLSFSIPLTRRLLERVAEREQDLPHQAVNALVTRLKE